MKYRILIVEDDNGIANAVSECLEAWDMECTIAPDFHAVLETFISVQPHLVIIDIGLPFRDGYYWCAEIRNLSPVPIVFISSASDNMNIVMAMNMGADDFIAKPFDRSVIASKVQALLRRAYDYGNSMPLIECRGAVLNTGDGTLTYNSERLDLSKNEFRILLALMRNRGSVVSRDRLMEILWETDCFVDENTLTVNVGRLRRKLENIGLKDYIVTKFGVGYIVGGTNEAD